MSVFKLFLAFVLCLASANLSHAIKPVVLSESLEELCIAREYVQYLEDKTQNMTIYDIVALGDSSERFIPSTAQDLINDNTGSAYWLKFIIEDYENRTKPFRIELFDFNIDEISFYYKDLNGKFVEHKAGFSFPFSMREINHKNISFLIPDDHDGSYMYMRFFSKKHNVLEPMVRSYDRYFNYALGEYIMFGILYGLLLLMIIYNFLYFFSLRKFYYLYFVLYGGGILIYFMSMNGTGFQYLWPELPSINDLTAEIGLFIGTLSMIMFTNSFLQLKRRNIQIYNAMLIAFGLRILIFGIQVIFPHFYLFEVIDLLYIQLVFFVALILYRRSIESAKWLVIAYSIFNLSLLISLLEQATILPSHIITVYSVKIGFILKFIFLTIGIAETIKEIYKQRYEAQKNLILEYKKNEALKEKVNRELEEKVRERTIELNRANEELKRRSEENIRMNIALDLANNELKKYLNNFARTSVMKEHLNFDDFKKAYPDEFSCIRYLNELKEKRGFICARCGHDRTIKGKAKFDLRCAKCNYNESLTANTIFHRIKFPLQKAYYMLYMVVQKKGDIPAAELARILDLQTITCQTFKNKIMVRMKEQKKGGKNKELSWEVLILNQDLVAEPSRATT